MSSLRFDIFATKLKECLQVKIKVGEAKSSINKERSERLNRTNVLFYKSKKWAMMSRPFFIPVVQVRMNSSKVQAVRYLRKLKMQQLDSYVHP